MLYQKHGKTLFKVTLILLITPQLRLPHRIMQKIRIISINKLSKKELYSTFVTNVENKLSSEIYFQNNFSNKPIKWNKTYYYHGKLHVTHIYGALNIEYLYFIYKIY